MLKIKVDEVVFGVVLLSMQLKRTKKYSCSQVVPVLANDVWFFFTYSVCTVLSLLIIHLTLKSYHYQGCKNYVESLPDILMVIVLSYFLV